MTKALKKSEVYFNGNENHSEISEKLINKMWNKNAKFKAKNFYLSYKQTAKTTLS